MRNFLAVLWSVFGMAFITVVCICHVPKENQRTVDTCLGFLLGTVVSSVLLYYFGSSLGSSEKNKLLFDSNPPDSNPEDKDKKL